MIREGNTVTRPELPITWPKVTAQLVLRPITHQDFPDIASYLSLPEVYGLTSRTYSSPTEVLEHLGERLSDPNYIGIAIERDGRLVGNAKLSISDAWAQVPDEEAARSLGEVGYTIDPAHANRGYATEALEAILEIAFNDLGLRRVEAGCFAMNTASRRVLEKAGMRLEGLYIEESLHHELGWVDGASYALLASEWRARQASS
ncbi:GNAT family N-acetyltransferase [Enemella sp. A6]|uniref:GNAT family N-acetyltransferase n=1 Tax=Enemella sp. A6 TaxID=3440152 RepID=UPI003EBCB6BD